MVTDVVGDNEEVEDSFAASGRVDDVGAAKVCENIFTIQAIVVTTKDDIEIGKKQQEVVESGDDVIDDQSSR